MAESASYSLTRYLDAKQTVDERALNRRVWSDFLDRLWKRHSAQGRSSILDVAGGIGSTLRRLLRALPEDLLGKIEYTLVDIDSALIEEAKNRLPEWGRQLGFSTGGTSTKLTLHRPELDVTISVVCADAFDFLLEESSRSYDCVLTQAWLDLVHVETALERIFRVLRTNGLFYAPIHFDGLTRFLPIIDDELDRRVTEIYHRSLDERSTPHGTAGGSRTGSRLLTAIPAVGGRIPSVGSSDWIVRPQAHSGYAHEEEYFLKCILRFVKTELLQAEDFADERARQWYEARKTQVESGTLRYVAHQLDLLAQNTGEMVK